MLVEDRTMTATEIAEAFDAEVIATLLSEATPGTREWTILRHAVAQNPVQCSCEAVDGPGPFRLDELVALDEELIRWGVPRLMSLDYPHTTNGLARAACRVRMLRELAEAKAKTDPSEPPPLEECDPTAVGSSGDEPTPDAESWEDVEPTLGPLTPEDDAARLQALADHAAAQGEGES